MSFLSLDYVQDAHAVAFPCTSDLSSMNKFALLIMVVQ